MPINKKMMASMKKEYGTKKAKAIYYAVEAKQKAAGKQPKEQPGKITKPATKTKGKK